jgi:hypothetical protein
MEVANDHNVSNERSRISYDELCSLWNDPKTHEVMKNYINQRPSMEINCLSPIPPDYFTSRNDFNNNEALKVAYSTIFNMLTPNNIISIHQKLIAFFDSNKDIDDELTRKLAEIPNDKRKIEPYKTELIIYIIFDNYAKKSFKSSFSREPKMPPPSLIGMIKHFMSLIGAEMKKNVYDVKMDRINYIVSNGTAKAKREEEEILNLIKTIVIIYLHGKVGIDMIVHCFKTILDNYEETSYIKPEDELPSFYSDKDIKMRQRYFGELLNVFCKTGLVKKGDRNIGTETNIVKVNIVNNFYANDDGEWKLRSLFKRFKKLESKTKDSYLMSVFEDIFENDEAGYGTLNDLLEEDELE